MFGIFVLGHAAVHAVMWTLPFTDAVADMPFDPGHSWVLGDQRAVGAVLAGAVTVAYVVASIGYFVQADWWPITMIGASVISLALMVLFFAPWWLVGLALSSGLLVHALQSTS